MRTISLSLLTILCLMLAVAPATADTLYDNGLPNGNTDAWTINFGFSVTDSFTCSHQDCSVEGFSMVTWNFAGDSLTNIQMQLGSTAFGSQFTDQVLSPSGSQDLGPNQYGFELWRYDFSFPNVDVPNGTSWLTLQNAVVNTGDPIYWDENSGAGCQSQGCPSQAFESAAGSIPSETFTVTGTPICGAGGRPDCGPPVPEPSSILLFGSGIFGIIGVVRRRLSR